MADFVANRPVRERINDALIYLLAQSSHPTFGNWWDAIDDVFDEFDHDEKVKIIKFGAALLSQARPQPRLPQPMLFLTDAR